MYQTTDDKAPEVSVVMPVHNAVLYLAKAIASVQAQSLPGWELVAVDDASTDGSAQMLADLARGDSRLKIVTAARNAGAGVARNLGMDVARGRFVAFLDADDVWHPEKLAKHLAWLKANPAALSFTAYLREDQTTGVTDGIGVPELVSYRQLLATNVIGCSTVIFDRAMLGEMRMPDLRLRQDFAFWLAILRRHGPARGLPYALTTYRRYKGQASGDKSRAAQATWAMYRQHLGLGLPQAGWAFANYALRGVLRHRAPRLARRLGWLSDPAAMVAPDQPVLTVAIATTAARSGAIDIASLPAQSGVAYHVFVQGAGVLPCAPDRPDVRISASSGRGAATNRNAALEVVTTPLLLFADDDLGFDRLGHSALIDRFAARPDADFLCARLTDEAGNLRKRYSADGQRVRWWNSGKIGTPELALRTAAFRARGLRFDPAFGAGMPDHLGDEYIFICDALRAGLRGWHVDIVVASHPRESSGTTEASALMPLRRRALVRALGRWQSLPARFAFALRHRRQFRNWREVLRFL